MNPYVEQLGLGRIRGRRLIIVTGINRGVGSSEVAIAPWDSPLKFPAAAATLTAESIDLNDAGAGTGAQIVRVEGLDANFAEITEDFTLNGVTPVAGLKSFLRINAVRVIQAGSTKANVGDIIVKHGADIVGQIVAGTNFSSQAIYTIPAGFRGMVLSAFFSANSTGADELQLNGYFRNPVTQLLERIFLPLVPEGSGTYEAFKVPAGPFEEKTDLAITGINAVGVDKIVSVQFRVLIVDKTRLVPGT